MCQHFLWPVISMWNATGKMYPRRILWSKQEQNPKSNVTALFLFIVLILQSWQLLSYHHCPSDRVSCAYPSVLSLPRATWRKPKADMADSAVCATPDTAFYGQLFLILYCSRGKSNTEAEENQIAQLKFLMPKFLLEMEFERGLQSYWAEPCTKQHLTCTNKWGLRSSLTVGLSRDPQKPRLCSYNKTELPLSLFKLAIHRLSHMFIFYYKLFFIDMWINFHKHRNLVQCYWINKSKLSYFSYVERGTLREQWKHVPFWQTQGGRRSQRRMSYLWFPASFTEFSVLYNDSKHQLKWISVEKENKMESFCFNKKTKE